MIDLGGNLHQGLHGKSNDVFLIPEFCKFHKTNLQPVNGKFVAGHAAMRQEQVTQRIDLIKSG